MSFFEIYQKIQITEQAEMTGKVLKFGSKKSIEWEGRGILKGIPMLIYYYTNEYDYDLFGEYGDWSVIDWPSRLTGIVIDDFECDNLDLDQMSSNYRAVDKILKHI